MSKKKIILFSSLICAGILIFVILGGYKMFYQSKKLNSLLVPMVKSAKMNDSLHYKLNGIVYFGKEEQDIDKEFYRESMVDALSKHTEIQVTENKKDADIVFKKSEKIENDEGYEIKIGGKGVEILYKKPVGAYYACSTLDIMLAEYGNKLPYAEIEDYPDRNGIRGYSLDMARDRVLTVDSLKQLVDDISAMKMNVLMIYLELPSSVALTEDEKIIPDSELTLTSLGTGLTTDELKEFAQYAKAHYVTPVPFIETVGHLWSLLQYNQYEAIRENTGYCNTITVQNQEAQKLLKRWIEIVAGCFESEYFMIGGDEAGELGTNRSIKSEYISHITGKPLTWKNDTYLDSLYILYNMVKDYLPNAKVLFWHDMTTGLCDVSEVQNAAKYMPDMIPCIWNYEGYDDEFKGETAYFDQVKGWNYWICPSTNSFTSITGRLSRCELNVGHAITMMQTAQKAEGFLITNWGDGGQKERLTTEYPGLTYGASKAWNSETSKENIYEYTGKMLLGDFEGTLTEKILELQRENDYFTHSWGCGWLGRVGSEGYGGIDMLSAFLYYQYARGNAENANMTLDDTLTYMVKIQENAENILEIIDDYELKTANSEIIRAEVRLTAKMTVYYCEYVKMRIELIKPYYEQAKEKFGIAFKIDEVGEAKFTAKLREYMGSDSLQTQIQKSAEALGQDEEYFYQKAEKMVEFSEELYEEYEKVWFMANVKGGFDESIGTLKTPKSLFENVAKAGK